MIQHSILFFAAAALTISAASAKNDSSAGCFVVQPTDGLSGGKLAPWVIKKGFAQGEDDERVADMGICDAKHHTIRIIQR